jgi:tetratricopeptide (TPR) repeat protein
MKQFAKGRETLERSLAFEPVLPETYSLLSALALLDKDTIQSRQYTELFLRETKKLDAPIDSLCAVLAADHSCVGLYQSAIQHYNLAISYKPNNPEYHHERGSALYSQGAIDSALSEFLQVLKLDSTWFSAHWMLGRIFETKGQKGNALEQYLAYLKRDSTSTEAKQIRQRVADLRRQR